MGTGELSDADLVWNRATQWDGPEPTAPGDRALAALLRVDGQIMNGGLESALEYFEPEDIVAAANDAHPEDFAPLEPS